MVTAQTLLDTTRSVLPMFTPPPSPLPRAGFLEQQQDQAAQLQIKLRAAESRSRRRKYLSLAVLLFPVLLVLSTLYTRQFSSRPLPRTPPPLEKRQALSVSTQAANDSLTPTPTTQGVTQQTIPPVPASPPLLPTPFPQPFDTSLSNNFSTKGCNAFFVNMTQTEPFRTCRPLSLLQQSSSAFLMSQTNLSMLTATIWGTCNTTPLPDQCAANMGWFAQEMQDVCKIDIANRVAMVTSALIGLQAYTVMRTAGCTINQADNTYCYADALHNSNPSDVYFYQLPLGVALPNGTTASCSPCIKSVLAVYGNAVNNVPALQKTYPAAAAAASKKCGSSYVETLKSFATPTTQTSRLWWISLFTVMVLALVS